MKLLIFAFFAFFTIVNCSSEQEWQNFKLKFEKGFKSIGHETERKVIFMENLREIESHNAKFEAGLTTYKKGINYYSDWTWEEFKDVVLMKEQVSRRNVHHPNRGSEEKIAGNFETSVAATTETDVIGDMIQVLEISKLPDFDRFDRHVEQTADPRVARNKGKPLVPALTDYKR